MRFAFAALFLLLAACSKLSQVGKAPAFSPTEAGNEYYAMSAGALPDGAVSRGPYSEASLWSGERASLLGDQRARQRGDILTVVVEIDDKAEMTDTSGRSRTSSEKMGIPSLLGIPQRLDDVLPDGSSMSDAINTNSGSKYQGTGSVQRKEKLTLRIAATVTQVLPNGVLQLQGSQEVRVNYEIRELVVTGYVRPEDISRQNEITYDKIAGARISYGGRGMISDVQQPRYGQQVIDQLLPF